MITFQDTQTEKAVLSSLTNSPLACIEHLPKLKELDFTTDEHREYYRALHEISTSGKTVDLVLIAAWIKQKGRNLDRDALLGISGYVHDTTNVKGHVDTVISLAQRRDVLKLFSKVQEMAFDEEKENNSLFAEIKNGLLDITNRNQKDIRTNDEIADSIIERVKALQSGELKLQGLTGLKDLDKYLLCEEGELITVAAGSNVGKSWIANNIAIHTNNLGKACVVASMEMSAEAVAHRVLSMETGHNVNEFREGRISLTADEIKAGFQMYRNSKIIINDKGTYTLYELESFITRMKLKNDIDIAIIDHGLLLDFGGSKDNHSVRIGRVTQRLKALSKDLKIKVVLLWQLNKSVELAPSGRPHKGFLKGSGSVYEDSDRVVMLWRPEWYGVEEITGPDNIEISTKGVIVAIIEKNRHGEVGKEVALSFQPGKGGFFNHEREFIKGPEFRKLPEEYNPAIPAGSRDNEPPF